MNPIAATLFQSSSKIRYVATYVSGTLELNQRDGIAAASSSESDKYEELIVNPTLLKLLEQRGNIDCGGMDYVIVRYGNFFEFVQPVEGGHVSVGIEPDAVLQDTIGEIRRALERSR